MPPVKTNRGRIGSTNLEVEVRRVPIFAQSENLAQEAAADSFPAMAGNHHNRFKFGLNAVGKRKQPKNGESDHVSPRIRDEGPPLKGFGGVIPKRIKIFFEFPMWGCFAVPLDRQHFADVGCGHRSDDDVFYHRLDARRAACSAIRASISASERRR